MTRELARVRTSLVVLVAVVAACALSSSRAEASMVDWECSVPYNEWCIRQVAHNYHYHGARDGSPSGMYLCSKLIRNHGGSDYGPDYCGYWSTGHHYAGDTGTKPLIRHHWGSTGLVRAHSEW